MKLSHFKYFRVEQVLGRFSRQRVQDAPGGFLAHLPARLYGVAAGVRREQNVAQLEKGRHEPTQDDIAMSNYFRQMGIPFTVVATKADKISRGARMKQIAPICRALLTQPWEIIAFSSEDGTGREQLLNRIETLLSALSEEPECDTMIAEE